jgi:hypothetical protein
MVELMVTRAVRHTEERHLGTAVSGVGAWSGRGWVPKLGVGALRWVRDNPGFTTERRTVV